MHDDGPRLTDQARRQAELKRQRLAEALRANLRRRKTQARARDEEAGVASPEGGSPEAQEDGEGAEQPSD